MAVSTLLGLRDWVRNCPFGDCCRDVHEDLLAPAPAGLRFTSIASRSDGVVLWRASQDPAAHCVEVDSSHGGMIVNATVWAAVARALTSADGAGGEPGHLAGGDQRASRVPDDVDPG